MGSMIIQEISSDMAQQQGAAELWASLLMVYSCGLKGP